jgi:hypothetical protein
VALQETTYETSKQGQNSHLFIHVLALINPKHNLDSICLYLIWKKKLKKKVPDTEIEGCEQKE